MLVRLKFLQEGRNKTHLLTCCILNVSGNIWDIDEMASFFIYKTFDKICQFKGIWQWYFVAYHFVTTGVVYLVTEPCEKLLHSGCL